ncbi:MAG: hypothetical protein Q8M31_01765 [Beijerinckiaceae bacterium]|nr:hypothetical protein [Beijerinckiaceae bacterium]
MRWIVIVLAIVGLVFIGNLLFWPSVPPTNRAPGYRPAAPDLLTRWLPNPPPAQLVAGSKQPPTELNSGGSWSGRFSAANGELGVVRVRLKSGALKVKAQERGEEDQLLCIVAKDAPRPSDCGQDNMANGLKGGVVVRKSVATVQIESPSGRATFVVNE